MAFSLSGYILQCSWTVPFYLGPFKYLEFGVLLSGITTSILALELFPKSLFHFLGIPYLVFCLGHKCIWHHRRNELGGWVLWQFLWVSHTPVCLIRYAKNTGVCLLFTWAISQELCLQQAVLKHEVRSSSGTKNRLAYSLLGNDGLPKLGIPQLWPELLCVQHPSRVTSCCAPGTWGPGNQCKYADAMLWLIVLYLWPRSFVSVVSTHES